MSNAAKPLKIKVLHLILWCYGIKATLMYIHCLYLQQNIMIEMPRYKIQNTKKEKREKQENFLIIFFLQKIFIFFLFI